MSNGKSILLIDDSRDHGFFLERALGLRKTSTSLFHLFSGEDGIAHLALCPTKRPMPDLVLLDKDMPGGMDGFETLRAIRTLAHLLELPVLMVCGSDDPEHVARAKEAGADGYVIKPCDQTLYAKFADEVEGWLAARGNGLKIVVPGSCAVDALPVRRVDTAAVSMDQPSAHSRVPYQLLHLHYAAEKVELPLSLLLNMKIKDHGVLEKRRYFVRVLLVELRWPDSAAQLYMDVSKRYLQECRNVDPALLPCANGARLLK